MEKQPAIKMRSSIACTRCRKSKVKCLNSGVNTPCRACESARRECTYPPPSTPGSRNAGIINNTTPVRDSVHASVGLAASGPDVRNDKPIIQRLNVQTGPGGPSGIQSASSVNVASPGNNTEKPKSRTKRQSGSQSQVTGSASHHSAAIGSSRPLSEALDPAILTPAVWSATYDLLTLHYPHIPVIHRPTFLRPLAESTRGRDTLAPQNPFASANSTSTTPPPAPSPFVLLGILALTGRFNNTLVNHHNTTPSYTSEYYASALRQKLLSIGNSTTNHSDDDDGLLTASLQKIQSLVMIAVHELGESHGEKAWLWLGIAVRMCQLLGLPAAHIKEKKSWIEEEEERRTWWAVVMLDRIMSSSGGGTGRTNAVGWEKVQNVPLPCSERAWLFGEPVKAGTLDLPILTTTFEPNHIIPQPGNGLKSPGRDDLVDETGVEESVHARLIRLLDIWGRVCQYLCSPETSHSSFETLTQELERWKDRLPKSLGYTTQNLSAHISAHTSSSYALLHTLYFLSMLLLNREHLPVTPTPVTSSTPNPAFSAARKITEIAREMHTWSSFPLTPIFCFAVYCAGWVGIYGLHYPQTTGIPGNGMGHGDAKHLFTVVQTWRHKWALTDGCSRALASLHKFLLRARTLNQAHSELNLNNKRRRLDDYVENTRMDQESLDQPAHGILTGEELKVFDITVKDFLATLPTEESEGGARNNHERASKRSRSVTDAPGDHNSHASPPHHISSSTYNPTSARTLQSKPSASNDNWSANDHLSSQADMSGRGLHGLVAAAHAGHQQLSTPPPNYTHDTSSSAKISPPSTSHSDTNAISLAPNVTIVEADIHRNPDENGLMIPRVRDSPAHIPADQANLTQRLDDTHSIDDSSLQQQSRSETLYDQNTPVLHTDLQSRQTIAAVPPPHQTTTDTSSDYSDQEQDVVAFDNWGSCGLARVDLIRFCEGSSWSKWEKGEDSWLSIG